MYSTGDSILVEYAEVIGDKIVFHSQIYKASKNDKENYIKISKLKFKHPVPPSKVMITTSSGKKMISIIKLDTNRFAYRIPTLHNQVYVAKRDENGNMLKDGNGKPILAKLKYTFTDNVLEPEVIHWAEAEDIKNAERHKIKSTFWDKFGGMISMGLIFVFALMMSNMLFKQYQEQKSVCREQYDAIFQDAKIAQNQAESTQRNLNNLIEKVTGQRVFDDEQAEREKYYNQTTG